MVQTNQDTGFHRTIRRRTGDASSRGAPLGAGDTVRLANFTAGKAGCLKSALDVGEVYRDDRLFLCVLCLFCFNF